MGTIGGIRTMKKETLGQVLKQRRGAYALTQRELARKLGVKASHVAYLENGRRRPSLSLLSRLADTLDSTSSGCSSWRILRRIG